MTYFWALSVLTAPGSVVPDLCGACEPERRTGASPQERLMVSSKSHHNGMTKLDATEFRQICDDEDETRPTHDGNERKN